MNCQQAQTIPITEYLASKGCFPVYSHSGGTEYSYHSPVRSGEDTHPSFDVDIIKNLWNDFAWTGSHSTGGDIVKLVCDTEHVIVSQALNILDESGLYKGQKNYTPPIVTIHKSNIPRQSKRARTFTVNNEFGMLDEKASGLMIENVQKIQNPLLEQYLRYRKIDNAIATRHGIQEINYTHSDNPDKKYFSLAWENDISGYELNRRGMYKNFKGCIGSKAITSIINSKSNSIALFEGFLDFLAYLSYFKIKAYQSSVICLNGTGQIDEAIKKVASIENENIELYLFTDNDEAGFKTNQRIMNSSELRHIEKKDKSMLYLPFKDFNDFTMNKKA